MKSDRIAAALLLSLLLVTVAPASAQDTSGAGGRAGIEFGVIDQSLVPVCYSGTERFLYDISYTGGLKLGELHLSVEAAAQAGDGYLVHARVTTENGIFSRLYPIEDTHVTRVSGAQRLPYHYEVWQKEGYSYQAHRLYLYQQDRGRILYRHNDKPEETFVVETPIHNEFSSFFASRLMDFQPGQPFLVATFADEKRNEVVVMVRGREVVEKTILGDVDTMVVEPIMEFSGLYDKRGDTVIWYSDDSCRVPVKVNSRLVIGSLTATLVGYWNPACPRYDGAVLEKYAKRMK